MEHIFYFILMLYFKHNRMSSTKFMFMICYNIHSTEILAKEHIYKVCFFLRNISLPPLRARSLMFEQVCGWLNF
jgi:hypothetical protein